MNEKDENVLACGGGRVFYGCWLGGELWAIARQPLEERLDFEVTHWMALPAPPEHFADVSKKISGSLEIPSNHIIGTPEHIQVALDMMDKKGGAQ